MHNDICCMYVSSVGEMNRSTDQLRFGKYFSPDSGFRARSYDHTGLWFNPDFGPGFWILVFGC